MIAINITSVVLGLATISSWILSMWLFFHGRKAASIETEKNRALAERIEDLGSIADSVAMQVNLIIEMSGREQTSKDELRHLAVSVQYSLLNLRSQTVREVSHLKAWTLGTPTKYLRAPDALASTRKDDDTQDTSEDRSAQRNSQTSQPSIKD